MGLPRIYSVFPSYIPGHLDNNPVDDLEEGDKTEAETEAETATKSRYEVNLGHVESTLVFCTEQ